MPDCTLQKGSRAIVLGKGEVRYERETHSIRNCSLETGSTIRIYSEAPSEREADRILRKRKRKDRTMEEKEVETVEEIAVSAEIEQAADAATSLGGEYAPIVAIILALLAVLGGKKAWSFYSERAEQKHELELKKLEMQRDVAGAGSSPPPSCQAVYTQIEASLEETRARVASIEKRLVVIGDDFDSEDIERQGKRLQKAVRYLQDDAPV